jgi:DNA-binding XRE family transcriptional regulator
VKAQSIAADLAGRACSDCRVREGGQHLPRCHRQGTVTATSDYRDRSEQALPVLSEAIRQVRIDAKMTAVDFAIRVGLQPRQVLDVEGGSAGPSVWALLKIGEMATRGPAKAAIIEELRKVFSQYPLVKVVA